MGATGRIDTQTSYPSYEYEHTTLGQTIYISRNLLLPHQAFEWTSTADSTEARCVRYALSLTRYFCSCSASHNLHQHLDLRRATRFVAIVDVCLVERRISVYST